MPARSLNKVILIGNLTRDPELRYTPAGNAVCNFGIATNRTWVTDTGEKREEAEFTRIVAWNKLAEICAQLLGKGDKVYVEGRLQTRQWQGSDGVTRYTTEVIANEMILLKSQRGREEIEETPAEPVIEEVPKEETSVAEEAVAPAPTDDVKKADQKTKKGKAKEEKAGEEPAETAKVKETSEDVNEDEIPF